MEFTREATKNRIAVDLLYGDTRGTEESVHIPYIRGYIVCSDCCWGKYNVERCPQYKRGGV